ncbi:hypothetical protein ACIQZO_28215 [Streptomyces sp. NPDC097617]|uniref:hypothetical protein n=1 Tax=Streptomyces sp. NPDC097617 TaxID=3366091 RepID=UPI00380DB2AE
MPGDAAGRSVLGRRAGAPWLGRYAATDCRVSKAVPGRASTACRSGPAGLVGADAVDLVRAARRTPSGRLDGRSELLVEPRQVAPLPGGTGSAPGR